MAQDKTAPRIRWRDTRLEGETQSEFEILAQAAVPHVRTGKTILKAVALAQDALPIDRRRGSLAGIHAIPPKLVKLIERAVEDSLEQGFELPKVPQEAVKYPQAVLDAIVYKNTHRCPPPPSADAVLETWLVQLGVKVAKALLTDPKLSIPLRAALAEMLPKPQGRYERMTQGTNAPLEPTPPPASTEALVRKPVVLVVGPKPGHERDAYERELGRVLSLKFFEGHTEGRGSRKLAQIAAGVDQAFVIQDASDHEQVFTLEKMSVPMISSRAGRSGTIALIKEWARGKGLEVPE